MKPRKGKAVVKEINGKKVSFGQAGKMPERLREVLIATLEGLK